MSSKASKARHYFAHPWRVGYYIRPVKTVDQFMPLHMRSNPNMPNRSQRDFPARMHFDRWKEVSDGNTKDTVGQAMSELYFRKSKYFGVDGSIGTRFNLEERETSAPSWVKRVLAEGQHSVLQLVPSTTTENLYVAFLRSVYFDHRISLEAVIELFESVSTAKDFDYAVRAWKYLGLTRAMPSSEDFFLAFVDAASKAGRKDCIEFALAPEHRVSLGFVDISPLAEVWARRALCDEVEVQGDAVEESGA